MTVLRAARAPVIYHYLSMPVPYQPALTLQQKIHELQLAERREGSSQEHPDILVLLQHRPVYTGGRRQHVQEMLADQERLQKLGSDWIPTSRGGETTFHGPGQIVAYPLFDIGRMSLSIRDYICHLQRVMKLMAIEEHGLIPHESSHTGLFLSKSEKLGSIGVQVRHRLTTHGLALNITNEPIPWFDQVVACGLTDVHAVSINGATGRSLDVESQVDPLIDKFETVFDRTMRRICEEDGEVYNLIRSLEVQAELAGPYERVPKSTRVS